MSRGGPAIPRGRSARTVWCGLAFLMLPTVGCTGPKEEGALTERRYRAMREKMVKTQISRRGIKDPKVLAALRKVPRHAFVPVHVKDRAYDDNALPIGEGQTISQPYIVGIMTELLQLRSGDKVLEIGTGSGYQAAVLSELVGRVFTIEIVEPLGESARDRLASLGYKNVTVRIGDGYRGWPEEAPFDAVIVTAAPDHVPRPLIDQLKMGGRLVIPVGKWDQYLKVFEKMKDGFKEKDVIPVRFVPMTGESEGGP